MGRLIRQLFVFVFLMVVSIFQLYSQQVWSLQSCIDYAYTHNLQISIQRLQVEFAEEQLLATKLGVLPNINANATHVYNYGQTVDRYTNQFASDRVLSNNFYANSSMNLFNGLQTYNSIKKQEIDVKTQELNVEVNKDEVALQIISAYLQILYNMEALANAEAQMEITTAQLSRTEKLVTAGKLTEGDLLNIKAQQSSDLLQIIQAENQLNISKITLAQLLDLDNVTDFDIEIPIVSIPEMEENLDLQQIISIAKTQRADLQVAALQLQSAEKSLAIARGMYSPTLSISGSVGTGYSGAAKTIDGVNLGGGVDTIGFTTGSTPEYVVTPTLNYTYKDIPFSQQIEDNWNQSFGFYLSIPIFNGYNTKRSINQAKIQIEQNKLQLQQSEQMLIKSIQQAFYDAKAAFKQYQAAKSNVEALELSFHYTQKRYDVGLINYVDYSDALNKLNKAKSDLLNAKYEYVFRIKILDFYQGKKIDF
jgi:outer membrane protein